MYTTIVHNRRKQMGLKITEYCILDEIYKTSRLNLKKINKQEIADYLDIPKSRVEYAINKFIKIGYLQKNKYNKNITITDITYEFLKLF